MRVTEYVLCEVRASGVDPFICRGIKITDKTDATVNFKGHQHEPYSVTFGERNIEFEIMEPEDHPQLRRVRDRCVENGETFTVVGFAKKFNGEMVEMEKLTDCVFGYDIERTLGDLSGPTLGSIKGIAGMTEDLNHGALEA